ncbi:MAG TPA: SpoIID/LytB domain-containing protein [bacterium]|nr:SpoIID/LytB domain-containing protein [bacterium]HNT64928.1 SpoIID/LytB domain-containing protein [bacterium]HPG44229.1 SpoIID/LytB domain-containing protein [bacterium]
MAWSAIIFSSCAGYRAPQTVASPIVRIGLLQNQDSVAIEPQGDFFILTQTPRPRKPEKVMGVWRVSVVESYTDSLQIYRLLFAESRNSDVINRQLEELRSQGLAIERLEKGEILYAGRQRIADTRVQQLYHPTFYTSLAAAEEARQRLNLKAKVVLDQRFRTKGKLRLTSPDGAVLEAEQAIRLSGPFFRIKKITAGAGYHWQRVEDRTFRGEIEVMIDGRGKLTVVNVLPLEEYLRGVVPQEMSSTFALEALKGQAVVARTFAVYHFSQRHTDAEFDYCADVHCQAYSGMEKESPETDRAVAETRGMVLTLDGKVCLTPFSAICGGHTEEVSAIWQGEPHSHLIGRFDVPEDRVPRTLDLSQESHIAQWITTPVQVFCNVDLVSDKSVAEYSRNYFRWQERLECKELENRIRHETGVDIGTLLEIRPLRRSVSGRLIEIELIGNQNRLRVENELKIRRLLSEKTLYSSCFVVEPEGNAQAPTAFLLKGAGWGHGVGMCQIGAAVMAEQGYTLKQILAHYYPGARIQALY